MVRALWWTASLLAAGARGAAVARPRRALLTGAATAAAAATLPQRDVSAAAPLVEGLWLGTCCDTGDGVRDVVLAALKEGWRAFDTAAFYGNEADVGAAIAASGVRPSDVRVTSKVWFDSMTYEGAKASAERSRALLGESLHTLLVHFPGSIDAVQSPKANQLRRAATWAALSDAKRSGVVQSIGVSNYTPRHAREQLRANGVPDVVQLESHPFNANGELVDLWRSGGVATLQAYSPFASGRAPVLADPTVHAVAQRAKASPAAVVLAWLRARGLEPVVKASTPAHRAAAAASLGLRLADDDVRALDLLDRGASVAFDAKMIA